MALPALVLLHGYPFDHSLWEMVAPALVTKIKVLTPDLPGFGNNAIPPPTIAPSIDYMADEVRHLIDAEHVGRIVLAGMSMGGYVALSFAERYADRLIGIALISTQATADTEEARRARRELKTRVRKEGPATAANTAVPKLFAPANANRDDLLDYPRKGAARAGVEGICWALEAMARRPDRTPLLSRLEVPSLVMHGAKDQFIPAERARQMAARIPNATYLEVPEAGHGLPLEAPEALVEALSNLVDQAERFSFGKGDKRRGIVIAPTEHGL